MPSFYIYIVNVFTEYVWRCILSWKSCICWHKQHICPE